MIRYPTDDGAVRAEVTRHGLTGAVVIRDVVRVVEVLNLRAKSFFSKKSVLAGSMALRCFGSPRFTVFDADFSTARPEQTDDVLKQFRYEDEELTISPQRAKADGAGSLLTIMPVTFEPIFTSLALTDDDKRFKADVSFRGVLRDGIEIELSTPYDLRLWIPGQSREVFVMDPAEALAEKLLGWAVHQETKHFADAAWITHQAWVARAEHFRFSGMQVKELLDAKLDAMRKLQSDKYAAFPNVEAVINKIGQPASLPQTDWNKLVYLKDERTRWSQAELRTLIGEKLMPKLRAAGR